MGRLSKEGSTFLGLTALAKAHYSATGIQLSVDDVAYLVRQIHIGYGCINECLHCFANPPYRLLQMRLSSFSQLAAEFGKVASNTGLAFPFLFLGSASDPSMVYNCAQYYHVWLRVLPEWHRIKLYTHGWILSSSSQRREFDSMCDLILSHNSRFETVNISLDLFSRHARSSWRDYLTNLASNLKRLAGCLSWTALRIHLIYPLSRLDVPEIYTVAHWRKLAASDVPFAENRLIDAQLAQAATPAERDCARLTAGAFWLGDTIGLNYRQTASISVDGVPIPGGRAITLYRGRSVGDAQAVLDKYQEEHLRPLLGFPHGTEGIVLFPDGTARLVDYRGYRLGPWLRDGQKVIPYVSSFFRQDSPWPQPPID